MSSASTISENICLDGTENDATSFSSTVIDSAFLPNNDLLNSQWYLSGGSGANVRAAWSAFGGEGITIGIVDQGFDITHSDLIGRFDLSLSYDPRDPSGHSSISPDLLTHRHGTAVAGVIGASLENQSGIVGIAPQAELAGFYIRLGSGGSTRSEIADLLYRQASVDISNNSWSVQSMFSDNFSSSAYTDIANAIAHAVGAGRDGLGTNLVFAAGNDRQYVVGSLDNDGDNTNYHNYTNARQIITVGASDVNGNVTSFSTPGASLLVSAPGVGILTTASDDGGADPADEYYSVSGTSFAAPVVSGVIALMLEANPDLGYRDVQDILALSSRKMQPTADHWQENASNESGSGSWNGGGNLFSHDLGFGLVDAAAATALAQSWQGSRTAANEASLAVSAHSMAPTNLIQGAPINTVFSVEATATALLTSWVEVSIEITHSAIGDLRITLRSPSGVESLLVDRPGAGTSIRDNVNFTLTSNAYRGENAQGDWTLIVEDQGTLGSGQFVNASLQFFGDLASGSQRHIITDDFAILGLDAEMIDGSQGFSDELNLAAVSGNIAASLLAGSTMDIQGRTLGLGEVDAIENLSTGFGNDTLGGNDSDNRLFSGRGNDSLMGFGGNDTLLAGDGDDTLDGGEGINILDGGSGDDTAAFDGNSADYVITMADDVISVAGNARFDQLSHIESLHFADRTLTATEIADLTRILDPVLPQPDFNWFVASTHSGDELTDMNASHYLAAYGGNGNDLFNAANNTQRVTLYGNGGADTLIGGHGNDYLYVDADDARFEGGAGFDYALVADNRGISIAMHDQGIEGAYGGGGNDTLDGRGTTVDQALWGNAGADQIFGGDGNDYVYVDAADTLYTGGAGHDYLLVWDTMGVSADLTALGFEGGYGGSGNDSFDASAATSSVSLWGNGGADQLRGGSGNDYLYVDSADTVIDAGAGYDWAIVNDQSGITLSLTSGQLEGAVGFSGNDVLNAAGSAAGVRLFGRAGDDTLVAGAGNDELNGEDGSDVFLFFADDMRANGQDFITDLADGIDSLMLDGITADQISITASSYGSSIDIALNGGGTHHIIVAGINPLSLTDQVYFS